jgi:glycosyltransferase involved in cell wall biosynthesis
MKVMVIAAAYSTKISGVQRHALNLVRCLLQRDEITTVQLVVAPWQSEMLQVDWLIPNERLSLHFVEMSQSSLGRNLWFYFKLPSLVARLEPDAVHFTYPVAIKRNALECATVATLHDLYPYEIPENFGFFKAAYNRLILRRCLSCVDAVTCVSDATLCQMKKYLEPALWQKALRIHNCVEGDAGLSLDSPIPEWAGEPFFLNVSQHRRNKNLRFLVRMFHRLLVHRRIDVKTKLVIVGINGPETGPVKRLVCDLRIHEQVVFLSGVSEPELQWCYTQCEVLVAPSSVEGFGLPVAEALQAGCRVVCSHIPAFLEIGGESCIYVPLNGEAETNFADAIVARLRAPKGEPLQSEQFSTSYLAEKYITLYDAVLAARSPADRSIPVHALYSVATHRRIP